MTARIPIPLKSITILEKSQLETPKFLKSSFQGIFSYKYASHKLHYNTCLEMESVSLQKSESLLGNEDADWEYHRNNHR